MACVGEEERGEEKAVQGDEYGVRVLLGGEIREEEEVVKNRRDAKDDRRRVVCEVERADGGGEGAV